MSSTAPFLQRHGLQVDGDELESLIEEAVRDLPTGLYATDAGDELTRAEVDVLDRGGLYFGSVDLGASDPLSRTTAAYVALMQTGLTVHEAADHLGVSDGRIRQLLAERRLFGLKKGSAWRVPQFQLDADGVVAGWDQAVAAVDPEIHPVALHRWATSSSPDLVVGGTPVSPIAWLRSGGDIALVVDQARGL